MCFVFSLRNESYASAGGVANALRCTKVVQNS